MKFNLLANRFNRLWETKNKNDEWWSSFVTSPLAILINCIVVEWKFLTPNRITSLSFLVSLSAAFLIITGGYPAFVLAAILINLSHVLDCMDGQMAQYRGTSSSFGSYYDKVTDQLKVFLFFAAVAYAAYQKNNSIVSVFLAFTGVSFYFIRCYVKYLTMFIEMEHNSNYLLDSAKAAANVQDKSHREVPGPRASFKCNSFWLLKEQRKFFIFNESVFIFMLSFGLIFNQIPLVLWVFAISQVYFGMRRSWQRGVQIVRADHEELLKPMEK